MGYYFTLTGTILVLLALEDGGHYTALEHLQLFTSHNVVTSHNS